MNRFRILPIGLLLAGITLSATEPAPADLAAKLLGVDAAQQAVWARAAKAGVLEVAPSRSKRLPPRLRFFARAA